MYVQYIRYLQYIQYSYNYNGAESAQGLLKKMQPLKSAHKRSLDCNKRYKKTTSPTMASDKDPMRTTFRAFPKNVR